MTIDDRFLPLTELEFNEAALVALKAQLRSDLWAWMKQQDFTSEEITSAAIGDVVWVPGTPATFRLRVTGKSVVLAPGQEPYLKVSLAPVE